MSLLFLNKLLCSILWLSHQSWANLPLLLKYIKNNRVKEHNRSHSNSSKKLLILHQQLMRHLKLEDNVFWSTIRNRQLRTELPKKSWETVLLVELIYLWTLQLTMNWPVMNLNKQKSLMSVTKKKRQKLVHKSLEIKCVKELLTLVYSRQLQLIKKSRLLISCLKNLYKPISI